MSYDRELRRLQCRVCGRTAGAPHVCSRCGAARLAPVGAGTDRVATVARRVAAAVWKFDTDAIRQGLDPRAALAPFRDRGGVLVATSLVLPYLEDLHPDLVAVVAADRWFHRPEFRAAERALALLRTTGMAAGVAVLVETADRDHPAIRGAMAPSLRPFYADELSLREAFGYPPYRSLFAVSVSAASAAAAHEAAARLSRAAPPSVEVLGPLPQPGAPPGPRHRGEAVTTIHHEFIIKAADRAAAREFLRPLLVGIGLPRGVRISVDVDPHEL
jgi:primosomal protein N' (replication factor Y)